MVRRDASCSASLSADIEDVFVALDAIREDAVIRFVEVLAMRVSFHSL